MNDLPEHEEVEEFLMKFMGFEPETRAYQSKTLHVSDINIMAFAIIGFLASRGSK